MSKLTDAEVREGLPEWDREDWDYHQLAASPHSCGCNCCEVRRLLVKAGLCVPVYQTMKPPSVRKERKKDE